jgi:hypothetical protein
MLGLHHIYLKRPHQCFLWCVSFGGYGVGLARDFFLIPRYAAEASGRVQCRGERPPMRVVEVIAMLAFASHMGWLARSVLPSAPTSGPERTWHSVYSFLLSIFGQVRLSLRRMPRKACCSPVAHCPAGWRAWHDAALRDFCWQAVGVWAVGNAPAMKTVSFKWVLLSVAVAESLNLLHASEIARQWTSPTVRRDATACRIPPFASKECLVVARRARC